MTEPNEPDKKNNETESTKDEAIIELKEEIADARTGDEEIIDLLEATEEQESVEDETTIVLKEEVAEEPTGDEGIINLVEAPEEQESVEDEAIIELKEEVAEEPTGDEEIIDLVEAPEEGPEDAQDESIDTEEQKATEDDTYIDLTVTISESHRKREDIDEPVADEADLSHEFDDIDEFDNALVKESVDFTDEFSSDAITDEAPEDDFTDSLGIELDSNEKNSEGPFEPDSITDEKIEAALERVIKKVFYEKIDRLLVDAIEKTVTREIEKLKKALLEDSPDGEK